MQTPHFAGQQHVVQISLHQIERDPNQPRKDFSAVSRITKSMDRLGQLQPILVTHHDAELYRIVDGDSRYQAAAVLGWESIQCIVVGVDDGRRRDVQFASNVVRSELNPFELADEYHRILEQHDDLTQAALAEELEESESTVSAILRLKLLPEDIKERLIPICRDVGTEALSLVSRAKPKEREKLVQLIVAGSSVAELRKVRKEAKRPKKAVLVVEHTKDEPVAPPSDEEPEENAEPVPASTAATSDQEPSIDEDIVTTWWHVFSVHAVRTTDLLEIAPEGHTFSTRTFATWLDKRLGHVISGYRLVCVSLAPGKTIYQLIPTQYDRMDYQAAANSRLLEHKTKG